MNKGGIVVKIAISLPDDVLQAVEKEREISGESRSEFFRRAVKALLKQKLREERDREYARAYREMPETEEELGWLAASSQAVLVEYPWDDDGE